MAANLSSAASKALQSESVRQSEAKEKRKKQNPSTAVNNIGPAILTNYGEREAKNNLVWAIGAVVVVVLMIPTLWIMTRSSPPEKALRAFTDPDPKWTPPTRIRDQQQRAWLVHGSLPIILNVDEAELESSYEIKLSPLGDVVAGPFKGMTYLPDPGLWVEQGKLDAARDILLAREAGLTAEEALDKAGISSKPQAALVTSLEGAGMAAKDAALVAYIMAGQTDFTGNNWIRERAAEGDLAVAIEIMPFRAENGRRLRMQGRAKYTSDQGIRYRGRLMRFVGWSGSGGNKRSVANWHVLDIQMANGEGGFDPQPGW